QGFDKSAFDFLLQRGSERARSWMQGALSRTNTLSAMSTKDLHEVAAGKTMAYPMSGVTLGCRNELCEPLRLPRRGEDRTPPTARGVQSFGVGGEEFNGNVDETLMQKADDDASLAGHCGVDSVAGKEIAE